MPAAVAADWSRPAAEGRGVLALLLAVLLCVSVSASAQTLPALTGRVVDQANLLPPDQEAALAGRLEALERSTSRQLVVVTVPNLQGQSEEDFAYRLGEAWKLGNAEADNGAILLVAVNERKIRIEVGDGLEPILTDAMSWIIMRDQMTPRFRQGDYVGGINAGTSAIIQQLRAPPEEAERRAIQAQQQRQAQSSQRRGGGGGSIFPAIFWIIILVAIVLPMLRRGRRGRRYGSSYGSRGYGRRRRGGWGAPVVIWGGGLGGGGGWGGGGGFSGGGGGGGGFGGFSGGGGSFGGGGASGGW
jgi:uncharacterized protein